MKKYRITAISLLLTLLLSSCSEEYIPPVNQSDLTAIREAMSEVSAVIFPDISPGIFTEGSEPALIKLTYPENTVLRYTADCSEPTEQSTEAMSGEIPLEYGTSGDAGTSQAIVRCALYSGGERVSDISTFVYTRASEGRFTMPVISVVSENESFYDNDIGILVPGKLRQNVIKHGNPNGWQPWYDDANFYRRGIEWERPVSLSVFDENGVLRLSQNCGVRVSGGYTRCNIQKSLRFYARRDYTPETGIFEYSFWTGLRGSHTGTPASYSDTVLYRGGSNNEGNSVFNTPCILMLLQGTALDSPAITPVVQFINGKYNGVITQLEDFDEDYFSVHYGIDKSELTTMKGTVGEVFVPGGWHIDDGPEKDEDVFFDMLKFIVRNDMSSEENYSKACEMLDMKNFIEYMAFEAFIANTDWPSNNLRAWRCNANGYSPDSDGARDGRWRFLAKDLDLSFGFGGQGAGDDPYSYISTNSGLLLTNLYNSLLKNPQFKALFYSFMCTLSESVITNERCEKVFDLMQVSTAREIEHTIKSLHIAGGSRGNWNNGFNSLRRFSVSRASSVLKYTKKHSGKRLTDVTVDINENGMAELGWFGIKSGEVRSYLRDNIIPLDVFPNEGYTAEITVDNGEYRDGYLTSSDSECLVKIRFIPDSESTEDADTAPIHINEVMFRGTEREWIELYNSSDRDIRLNGWRIGKKESSKDSQIIPATVIPAHGYALISCTDFAQTIKAEGLSVHMSLSNGSTLYLFDENGNTIDSALLDAPSKTVHVGRYPDGGKLVQMSKSEATPSEANRLDTVKTTFFSESFKPCFVIFGRVYEYSDLVYEKNGMEYINREYLSEILDKNTEGKLLYRHLKKRAGEMTLDELVEYTYDFTAGEVREVPELGSYIISY